MSSKKHKFPPRTGDKFLQPEKELLSISEAARMLCLAVWEVRQMVDNGTLKARLTPGGHRRIYAKSVRLFLESNKYLSKPPAEEIRLAVLIAEDDEVQCKIYESGISSWGLPIDLRIVPDGFAAILEASQKTPDVMVIDLMLPKLNGFNLIRCVRSDPSFDKTDLLVVTGLYPEEIAAEGGVPADAVVVEKPISLEMLHGFMRASLAAKQRNSGSGKA